MRASRPPRVIDPVRDNRWQAFAACRDVDAEMFFPAGTSGPALVQIAEAKAVCARCPVRDICLEWSLTTLEYGVAAGLTEDERRAVRRERSRQTVVTA